MHDGVTFSIFAFFKRFPNAEAARLYIEKKRWNGKPVCPYCGCDHTQTPTTRKDRKGNVAKGYYNCYACKKVYTIRTGTVMARSHIALDKWLFAIYYMLTARHGVSSYQLSKHIDIHQESAWFLMSRIREACKIKENAELLEGIVEIDETYVGGVESNKHSKKKLNRGRGAIGKATVIGLYSRTTGRTYSFVVPTANRRIAHDLIKRWVKRGSTIITDEASIYDKLEGYNRLSVAHGAGEYSRDSVTTNRIESVWACTKRAILGIWHHVNVWHLQRYIDEVCFRLSEGHVERHLTERMDSMLEGVLATDHITFEEMRDPANKGIGMMFA